MSHYLLGQLAAQRQTQSADRAAWERHTSPTRPISASSRRRAADPAAVSTRRTGGLAVTEVVAGR